MKKLLMIFVFLASDSLMAEVTENKVITLTGDWMFIGDDRAVVLPNALTDYWRPSDNVVSKAIEKGAAVCMEKLTELKAKHKEQLKDAEIIAIRGRANPIENIHYNYEGSCDIRYMRLR